ncbi:MAG: V-type ATP synthase subunit E family protein [Candidatus Izemoplasmatales bacterium]|nr:V-type ATP synthase subunit E family protein [Candidatus Izemoplasmatales bacterium]
MEYYSSDQLFKYFSAEIKSSANAKMNQLRKEIDELKAVQLKKIDEELKSSVERALTLELKEADTDYSYEINRILMENSKKLMNKRTELLNSVFNEVKSKLLLFLKTDEYKSLMNIKVESLNTLFKNKKVIFNIMKNDKLLTDAIINNFHNEYEIKPTDKIVLGGFFADCDELGIEVDETLDFKLEDKKQWFYEKSNLFINK